MLNEGVTGWAISNSEQLTKTYPLKPDGEADILYSRLENIIIPMCYHHRDAYIEIMRNAIAINGYFSSTKHMISQYVTKAYFR